MDTVCKSHLKITALVYLLVNPVAMGKGLPLFNGLDEELALTLVKSKQFGCGTIMLCYKPK
jgi:hypothetical protein